jgi:transcriptional regulator with XRE-family HTH domain
VTSPEAHEIVTENLRRLTEAKDIPLTVVADRAGIDRRELFAMMAGEYDPDLDWLGRLADALEVPMSELFLEVTRQHH